MRPAQHSSPGRTPNSPQHLCALGMQKPFPAGLVQHFSVFLQQSSRQSTGLSGLQMQAPVSSHVCPRPQHWVTLVPAQHFSWKSSQQTVLFLPRQPFSHELQHTPRSGSAHFWSRSQHVLPHGCVQHLGSPPSTTHVSSGRQQSSPLMPTHALSGAQAQVGLPEKVSGPQS